MSALSSEAELAGVVKMTEFLQDEVKRHSALEGELAKSIDATKQNLAKLVSIATDKVNVIFRCTHDTELCKVKDSVARERAIGETLNERGGQRVTTRRNIESRAAARIRALFEKVGERRTNTKEFDELDEAMGEYNKSFERVDGCLTRQDELMARFVEMFNAIIEVWQRTIKLKEMEFVQN